MPHQRIMVADDEQDILWIVQRALQKYGFIVEAYSDPLKALESFASSPLDYVLIITDVRMPGMNGFQLAERIRAIQSGTKILFMTAFLAEEINVNNRTTVHKRDIVEKPFTVKTICDQVKLRLPATS